MRKRTKGAIVIFTNDMKKLPSFSSDCGSISADVIKNGTDQYLLYPNNRSASLGSFSVKLLNQENKLDTIIAKLSRFEYSMLVLNSVS